MLNKYKNAEAYIESLSNTSDVNFHLGTSNPEHHFKRAKLLLKLAGNPDKKLKIIHVAGTSGKGSTVNLIYNILQKAGYKVGAHFSPFVSVATEKIQINGKFISMSEFVELVDEVKPIIEKCYKQYDMPSYFEVWLLLTLKYFVKQKVDYVVLETGCGGRYDGTNAVVKTLVSIITNIGLDHTHILGDTIEKIAFEKAGIIRKKGKVFTSIEKPKALDVVQKECDKLGADLTITKGRDAIDRASTLCYVVCEYLGINEKYIKLGINSPLPIPARQEILYKNPTIMFDGAHNQDKLTFLANKIQALNPKPEINSKFKIQKFKKLHLICALGQNKKPKDCFKEIIKLANKVYVTRSLNPFRKFIEPLALAKDFKSLKKIPIQTYLDPNEALAVALKNADKDDLILITGSFFLCSDLRKRYISEEKQLEQRTNFPK